MSQENGKKECCMFMCEGKERLTLKSPPSHRISLLQPESENARDSKNARHLIHHERRVLSTRLGHHTALGVSGLQERAPGVLGERARVIGERAPVRLAARLLHPLVPLVRHLSGSSKGDDEFDSLTHKTFNENQQKESSPMTENIW